MNDLREEIFTSACDGRLGVGVPAIALEAAIDPEGGDEHKGGGDSNAVARGTRVPPVGSPAHILTAGEEVCVGTFGIVVVYEPTFGCADGGDVCR